MRKVLSFVLVLSLVLGSFSAVFAAGDFSDVVGTKYEDAVNVLSDLGVVSGNPDGTYKPEDTINRAEMAKLIVAAMGLEKDVNNDNRSSFTDMSGYGWAEGYVSIAQGLGVVSGYGDGTFQPGNPVSYDEAYTMLVNALGYKPAALNGTWPANYVSQARALGISKDIVSTPGGASRGDVAIMIYQTLNVRIGSTNSDGNWVPNAGSDTMMQRLGAEFFNGEDEFFVLTEDEADTAVINVRPYIGAYIKAYVNKDGDIIALNEVKSTFLSGKLNKDGKFKAAGVEYNISNDLKATTITAFSNGIVDSKLGDNLNEIGIDGSNYVKVTIAADVSGKTIRDIYSVTKWDANDYFLWEKDMADDIKSDKLGSYDLPLDNNNDLDYSKFALIGVDTLDDLAEDNVVYIYADKATKGTVTRVEVGTEIVTGNVTRVRDDFDLTIGGVVYEKADLSDLAVKDMPSAGDAVKLFLDHNGDYFDLEITDGTADNYAVVINRLEGGYNVPEIRLFMADKTSKSFEVDYEARNVKDFFKKDSNDKPTDKWNGSEKALLTAESDANEIAIGDLIKYGVDSSGTITSITKETIGTQEQKDITDRGVLSGANQIANNAVIFTFDAGGSTTSEQLRTALANATAGKLGVTTYNKVTGLKKVNARYILDNDKIVAMILDDKATSDDDVFGVILNADYVNTNNAGGEIEMYVNGVVTTFEAEEDTVEDVLKNKEKMRNLVILEFNSAGAITGVDVVDKDTQDSDDNFVLKDDSDTTVTVKSTSSSITIKNEKSVDSPYYIYKLDSENDWVKVNTLRSLNNEEYARAYAYDCIDGDNLVDTIVVVE